MSKLRLPLLLFFLMSAVVVISFQNCIDTSSSGSPQTSAVSTLASTSPPVSAAISAPAAATPVSDCSSIETFGGKADGSTDNLAAWNAAVATLGSKDVCIKFGPGVYNFSDGAIAALKPNISIKVRGSGKGVTHLVWTRDTHGMILQTGNQQTVDIQDISFETSVANSHNALTVKSQDCTGARRSSSINNVSFSGDGYYPFPHYWTYGLVIYGLSFVNLNQLDFFSDANGNHMNGLTWDSPNAPACFAIVLNASQLSFIGGNVNFTYGNFVQGVTLTQSNFTNGKIGILVPGTSVNTAQLTVSDSQFNTSEEQVFIQAPILGAQFHHNTFTIPANHTGIHIANGAYFNIDGNIFFNETGVSGMTGVQIDGNLPQNAGVITANAYSHLSYGNSLMGGTSGWTVQANSYTSTVKTKNSNQSSRNSIGMASE